MKPDPIVEEIHEIRRKMLEECGGDMDELFERIQAAETRHPDRLVTREEFLRRRERKPVA